MSRRKFRNNKQTNILLVISLLLCISLGFALISTNLKITGTANIPSAKWDIYWNNLNVSSGSVTGTQVNTPAAIKTGKTEVEFSVTLKKPGDFYEFTVDAVNAGSLNAMIGSISNKIYAADGTTEKTLPNYLSYSVTYDDNIDLAQYHKLGVGVTETIKVRVAFRTDISNNQLPESGDTVVFKYGITYVQADDNAIYRTSLSFSDSSWNSIVSKVKMGNIPSNWVIGSTKEVDMGSFGTHTLRISNMATPSECAGEGFSQTACGFVLEFTDIVTRHSMNSTSTNVGGWYSSEARTYINNDIYNALPTELKNGIIDTTVVSGHGSTSGEENFTSTDKLYLLSTKEIGFNSNADTAKNNTRILDYYNSNNTDSSRIKKYSGTSISWWLSSAYSNTTNTFSNVYSSGVFSNSGATSNQGISPAFRIA